MIQWYQALEQRLLSFVRHVPPTPQNLHVSSHELAGIITEACGVLDSLFRRVSTAPKPGDLDITDHAKNYGLRLGLPSTASLFLVSPIELKAPFQAWSYLSTPGASYQPTSWWTAHTRLKHNRIEHISHATLEHAIDSLCGLHQVIARLPEMASATLRHGWLDATGWNQEWLVEEFTAGRQPEMWRIFLVESALFAVPIGDYAFPSDLSGVMSDSFVCSQRLRQFLTTL